MTDKKTGRVVDGYLAFNIIGVIAAADVTASRYASGPADCLMSADIGLLAVESEKVAEVKMFRLAESSSTILVSEEVKASFEAGGMSTVTFLPFEQ